MKKFLFIISILGAQAVMAQAQNVLHQQVQHNLDEYNDFFQPEYIELNFDKDFYFSGEKIWYSLHLTNQAYLTSSTSAVVYIDVRDQRDSVLIRQKIRCKQGLAHGDLSLPKQFPTGYYKIIPFTLWMMNSGNYRVSEKRIPVIHPANFSVRGGERLVPAKKELLKIQKNAPGSFTINVTPGTAGNLIVYNREEVQLFQKADASVSVSLTCEKPGDRYVYVVLADDEGSILERRVLQNSNIRADAFVSLFGQHEFSPGDVAEFTIDVKDKMGRPLTGNISVSVRPRDQVLSGNYEFEPQFYQEPTKINEGKTLPYKKEVFVYPKAKGSLVPIDFSPNIGAIPFEFSDVASAPVITADMMKKITRGYGQETFYETEVGYNLPVNISYTPSDYLPLASVEDFIREAVATLKVRRVKGQDEIFVRNSDTQSNIFFYKKPCLILIDGNIAKTAEELLSISLSDIEKIEVLWETSKINSMSIFSFADNGIVSVTTKSKSTAMSGHDRLLTDFYAPLVFSNFKTPANERAIPVLTDPVYWNPQVTVDGKKRISFKIPDELGELIIAVSGYTEIGDYISGEAKITVKLPKNR